jgi:predicted nucleotidyltransferase
MLELETVTFSVFGGVVMLSEQEMRIIDSIAGEYKVKRLWLFGSSLDASAASNDIDLAAEGVLPKLLFSFYGKLILALDRPVDLVDITDDPPIASIIRKTGRVIYGCGLA